MLRQLLKPGVKEADLRVRGGDFFPIQRQQDTEGAMGSWVLRTHVEHHFLPTQLVFLFLGEEKARLWMLSLVGGILGMAPVDLLHLARAQVLPLG